MGYCVHGQRVGLLLIVILFALSVALQSRALPLLEGSDEDLHYLYIEYVRANWALPERIDPSLSPLKQQSGQPPLTYWVGAWVANALALPRLDALSTLYDRLGVTWNPWNTPAVEPFLRDNHNFYYVVGTGDAAIRRAIYTLRLLSLAWGVCAIAGAYVGARALFPDARWALLLTALFALLPTFTHSASYINNDVSATALATWALALTLRAMRKANHRVTVIIGVLVALCGLAKISALLIAPACVVGILSRVWKEVRFGGRLAYTSRFLLPILLLFAPWAAWGWLHYGDPLGVGTHGRIGSGYAAPLMLADLLAQLPSLYRTYLARFGLSAMLPPSLYLALSLPALLALAGLGIALARRARPSLSVIILLLALGGVGAGVVRWMLQLPAIPGRLLLPAHFAIIALLVLGLRQVASRLPRWGYAVRVASIGIVAFAGVVVTPLAVERAYTFSAGAVPAPQLLRGQARDYDHALRFLGYQTADIITLTPNHPVMTCWEILGIPPREPAYTLKLIGEDGIVTERTSIMGLGLFPRARWQVGDRWCETIALPLANVTLRANARYNLVLAVLDAQTFASDWRATALEGVPLDTQFLGELRTPEVAF